MIILQLYFQMITEFHKCESVIPQTITNLVCVFIFIFCFVVLRSNPRAPWLLDMCLLLNNQLYHVKFLKTHLRRL